MGKLIPYEVPEQDADLWNCGVNLKVRDEAEAAATEYAVAREEQRWLAARAQAEREVFSDNAEFLQRCRRWFRSSRPNV